jgi:hypothetical protein
MKVGIFNNMNNSNFCLARYLRDLGHDVTLFLLGEQPHFMPDKDTYDSNDLNIVQSLNWYKIGHWKTSAAEIRTVTDKFDFLIGSDMVPAFFYKAGVKLDLMFPHGGDIFYKPYFKYDRRLPLRAQVGLYYEKYCQRKGLRNCGTVSLQYLNENFEYHLKKLRITHNRSYAPAPSLYWPQYEGVKFEIAKESNPYYLRVAQIKAECELLIIQQGRHEHSDPLSLHYKGNEKLFKAVQNLIIHHGINAHLVLFEYGDVELSKRCIAELGLTNSVTWLPLMARKDLMPVLSLADVGVGILGDESHILYGSANEILVMKVPLLHYLSEEAIKKQGFRKIYPYLNARSIEDATGRLLDVYNHSDRIKLEARGGLDWFKECVIEATLTEITALMKNA